MQPIMRKNRSSWIIYRGSSGGFFLFVCFLLMVSYKDAACRSRVCKHQPFFGCRFIWRHNKGLYFCLPNHLGLLWRLETSRLMACCRTSFQSTHKPRRRGVPGQPNTGSARELATLAGPLRTCQCTCVFWCQWVLLGCFFFLSSAKKYCKSFVYSRTDFKGPVCKI